MKLQPFDYFVTDIDGTLTDGKVYMGNDGEAAKAFSIKDGYAFSFLLKNAGVETIVITGRRSAIVENRCRELGISNVSQGVIEKLPELKKLVGENNLGRCVYFGDDILDLSCMLPIKGSGGIVGCPADAVSEVKAIADFVCTRKAGDGAAREFVEWLLSDKPDPEEIEKRVAKGIQLIKNLADENAEDGLYCASDWLTVEIKRVKTNEPDAIEVESHRKHVDIQWVIEGEEAIDIASAASLYPRVDYDEKKDVVLWHPKNPMTRVALHPGSYVVLYPEDAHRPCISLTGMPSEVRVAVAKVLIS